MPLPSRLRLLATLLILLPLGAGRAWAGGGFDDAALVAKLLPSVVAVEPELPPLPGSSRLRPEHAAGFVIGASGTILTNGHVVDGAARIMVTLSDGTTMPARLLYRAPLDLAILQVDAGRPLPVVRWGDSDALRPGDGVIAIGNPLGVGISVSAGIVSAIGRDIHASPHDDFIQTDAALNHGNSGGPLFNLQGDVVGVATGLLTPKGESGSIGVGLAIPSDVAQFVVDSFRQYGRLREGWLGLSVAALTPAMAESLELAPGAGLVVTAVPPGTPAARAGVQPGDVILSAGGQKVHSARGLHRRVMLSAVGSLLPLGLERGGMPAKATVTVGEAPQPPQPPAPPKPPAAPGLGMTLAPLDTAARAHWHMAPGEGGVLVARIAPGGTAAERGVAAGDVIERVQWEAVSRPEDAEAAIAAARGTGRRHVLLALRGAGALRLVVLPLTP